MFAVFNRIAFDEKTDQKYLVSSKTVNIENVAVIYLDNNRITMVKENYEPFIELKNAEEAKRLYFDILMNIDKRIVIFEYEDGGLYRGNIRKDFQYKTKQIQFESDEDTTVKNKIINNYHIKEE